MTGSTKIGRVASELLTLSSRIIVVAGWAGSAAITNTTEEYNYETGTWTLLTNNMIQSRRYLAAASVPAILFNNFPGGCVGVM